MDKGDERDLETDFTVSVDKDGAARFWLLERARGAFCDSAAARIPSRSAGARNTWISMLTEMPRSRAQMES